MSSWGQVEAFSHRCQIWPPGVHPFAVSSFPTTFSHCFLSCRDWTVAYQQHPEPLASITLWDWPQDHGLRATHPSNSSPYCGVCS